MWKLTKLVAFCVAGVVALLAAAAAFSLLSPPPALVISKQATVITQPLTAEGLPDYEAHLLNRGREGVTPDNNAAVLLVEALWPAEIAPADQPAVLQALGMTEAPSGETALIPTDDPGLMAELEEQFGAAADEALAQAMERPWTTDQAPALAEWLAANEQPLDLIVEATTRPRYWLPSPKFLNGRYDPLVFIDLPLAQTARHAANALAIRSMRHAGAGRQGQAWQDLMAVHRLANFIGDGNTLVELLCGHAMSSQAYRVAHAITGSSALSADSASLRLAELRGMPYLPPVLSVLDGGERLGFIDGAISVSRSDATWPKPDVNDVLKRITPAYDKLVAAGRFPRGEARRQLLLAADADRAAAAARRKDPARLACLPFSRPARSGHTADLLVAEFMMVASPAYKAEDILSVQRRMSIVSAALELFRARRGEYPQSLEQLTPDPLPEAPTDVFSAKPLRYNRKPDGGYLLYSLGRTHATITVAATCCRLSRASGCRTAGCTMSMKKGATSSSVSLCPASRSRRSRMTISDDKDVGIVDGEWIDPADQEPDDAAAVVTLNAPKVGKDLVIRVPLPPFRVPTLPAAEP